MYTKLWDIKNMLDPDDQLRAFAKHYSSLKIAGMHYIDFNSKLNIIHIYTPNQELHYYGTSYLLNGKYMNNPINTVLRMAQDLRKFLDFIMIWKLDLLQVNTLIVIEAFVSYLRLLKKIKTVPYKAIEWSLRDKLPLHDKAVLFGKLTSLGLNNQGILEQEVFEDYEYETIKSCVQTACGFMEFLRDDTKEYVNLDLSPIPYKYKKFETVLTGTTNRKSRKLIADTHAILEDANIRNYDKGGIKPLSVEVMTIEDIVYFRGMIRSSDFQTNLLFYVLISFGLRRSEARNLMIVSKGIPKDLYLWDVNKARQWLLNEFKGDISFDKKMNCWVCNVIKRKTENFQCQNKSANRAIPLLFSQSEFTSLLLEHITARQLWLESSKQTHDYLFYSNSNNSKGKAICGGTIYSKYRTIISGSNKEEYYLNFSPHSFRHFFATYLIRIKRIPLSDVSRFLGHQSESTTKKVYLHYLPNVEEQNREKSRVSDMPKTFINGRRSN